METVTNIHSPQKVENMSLWNNVDWRSTVIVNLERAVAAAIVWAALDGFGVIDFSLKPYEIIVMFPLGYFFIAPLWWFIGKTLFDRGIKEAGLIMLATAIPTIVGDPFVWLLQRVMPQAVPVDEFGIVNRNLLLIVEKR